ncbi:hypothetical protein D3C73_816260 [compost metagenome]
MESPNYLRSAIEFFKRTKSRDDGAIKILFDHALTAPKFALPDGGKILDNKLKCRPT